MTKKQRTKLESEHDVLVIMLYEWENDGAFTSYGLCYWFNYIDTYWWMSLPGSFYDALNIVVPSIIKHTDMTSGFLWATREERISAMKKAIIDIQKQLYES